MEFFTSTEPTLPNQIRNKRFFHTTHFDSASSLPAEAEGQISSRLNSGMWGGMLL
jgi:hypothetical protein